MVLWTKGHRNKCHFMLSAYPFDDSVSARIGKLMSDPFIT